VRLESSGAVDRRATASLSLSWRRAGPIVLHDPRSAPAPRVRSCSGEAGEPPRRVVLVRERKRERDSHPRDFDSPAARGSLPCRHLRRPRCLVASISTTLGADFVAASSRTPPLFPSPPTRRSAGVSAGAHAANTAINPRRAESPPSPSAPSRLRPRRPRPSSSPATQLVALSIPRGNGEPATQLLASWLESVTPVRTRWPEMLSWSP